MTGSVGTAGRRLVKGILRVVGLELRRYSPASPIQGSAEAKLPNEGNKLSLISAMGRSLPRRPAPFVLVATNHGTFIVNRNDSHVDKFSPGYGVGHQLLNSSSFDHAEVALALALLSKRKELYGPGVVALDCGANVGVHSVEWARHMHGWGNVIAIEAQERIFYALCGNLTMNNCMNAKAIWAAVGAKSGEMRIPIPDYHKPASFGSLELRKREATEFIGQEIDYSEDASATVDAVSIDDLEVNRLDFLKIDVEGMEMDVLVGARKTIERVRPLMMIEIVKSNRSEIISFLESYGYTYYCFEGNVLAVQCSDPTTSHIAEVEGFMKVDLGSVG